MTRSFDVFDTLLARRYINSNVVWDTLEKSYQIDGFTQARIAADTGNRNIEQIYDALVNAGIISQEQREEIYLAELLLEKNLAFPIKENIDKVRNGDILVSDMYLRGSEILDLVRFVGMDKQVSIYQSNGDKSSGAFWSRMKGKLDLEYHMGDNINSDVNQPTQYGFNAVHYPNAASLTSIEQFFMDNGLPHLGLLVRETRLIDHSVDYAPYLETANQKNLPWLFMVCEILYRKYKNKEIVFLGRDCQLLYKIYSGYYPAKSQYLPFSREVALNQPEEAVTYLKHYTSDNSVLVDISSTGKTWQTICDIHPFSIEVVIYSDLYWYSSEKPVVPTTFSSIHKNSVIGGTNILIEIFNCGDHGKMRRIHDVDGFPVSVFSNISELPEQVVDVIHRPVNNAVNLRKKGHYSALTSELANIDQEMLINMSASLLINICSTDKNALNVLNPDDGTYIMNEFDSKEAEYLSSVSF